jgi:chromodomain-helicase-DNA-binding protein 7
VYPPEKKIKEEVTLSDGDENDANENNKKNKNKSIISKCSTANCNRYFHLNCI